MIDEIALIEQKKKDLETQQTKSKQLEVMFIQTQAVISYIQEEIKALESSKESKNE